MCEDASTMLTRLVLLLWKSMDPPRNVETCQPCKYHANRLWTCQPPPFKGPRTDMEVSRLASRHVERWHLRVAIAAVQPYDRLQITFSHHKSLE